MPISITRAYGSLVVSAASAGALWLDGEKLCDVPAGASANLGNIEAGERNLEMRYADGEPETKTVTVTGGQSSTVSFTWQKDGSRAMLSTVPASKPNSLVDAVYIPGGTFLMGSLDDAYATPHNVNLSSFWMAKTEVTQELYESVMGTDPSYFTGDSSRPVEQVSWYDAVAFCNALSQKEGLSPVYTITGTKVKADFGKNGWRLPTEAEWEYAARGGSQAASHNVKFAGSASLDDVAWYKDNSEKETHPVGSKTPNELGLYDMNGNVWEWCWDWYGSYPWVFFNLFQGGTQTDPKGPVSGMYRVIRGGSWYDDGDSCTVSYRKSSTPDGGYNDIGFRVVCSQ